MNSYIIMNKIYMAFNKDKKNNKNTRNITRNTNGEDKDKVELNDFQKELLKYLADNNKNTENFINKVRNMQKDNATDPSDDKEDPKNILPSTELVIISSEDIDKDSNIKKKIEETIMKVENSKARQKDGSLSITEFSKLTYDKQQKILNGKATLTYDASEGGFVFNTIEDIKITIPIELLQEYGYEDIDTNYTDEEKEKIKQAIIKIKYSNARQKDGSLSITEFNKLTPEKQEKILNGEEILKYDTSQGKFVSLAYNEVTVASEDLLSKYGYEEIDTSDKTDEEKEKIKQTMEKIKQTIVKIENSNARQKDGSLSISEFNKLTDEEKEKILNGEATLEYSDSEEKFVFATIKYIRTIPIELLAKYGYQYLDGRILKIIDAVNYGNNKTIDNYGLKNKEKVEIEQTIVKIENSDAIQRDGSLSISEFNKLTSEQQEEILNGKATLKYDTSQEKFVYTIVGKITTVSQELLEIYGYADIGLIDYQDINLTETQKTNLYVQTELKYKVNTDVSFVLESFPESFAKGYVFSSPNTPWNWDANKDYEENKKNIYTYLLEYNKQFSSDSNTFPQFLLYYIMVTGSSEPYNFFVSASLKFNKVELHQLYIGENYPIVLVKE